MKTKCKQTNNLIKIVIISIVLVSCVFQNFTYASQDESSEDEWWVGTLYTPLGEFFAGFADAVINILQGYLLPNSPTAIMYRTQEDIGDLTLYNIDPDDIDTNKSPIPKIYYSPGAIFSNTIPAFDVNFINPTVTNQFTNDKTGNVAEALSGVIQKWYVALRAVAIVGLLIVLVYLGIRIIISSTADETAKFKEMLRDWVIALILVFFMHYIILAMLLINELIINVLRGAITTASGLDILMSQARMEVSAAKTMLMKMGHIIIYFVLVIYTVRFTIRYLKRVIYMAFLTLISPLVALTYPIDKSSSGRSPAFGMWFKEYLFNLLLQPVHLLLYTVLVASAMELATSNMLYGLIAVGFIVEAEEFVKKMFGIKADGGLGKATAGFAAGSIFASGLKMLRGGAQKATNAIGNGGSKEGSDKARLVDKPKDDDEKKDTDMSAFDSDEPREEPHQNEDEESRESENSDTEEPPNSEEIEGEEDVETLDEGHGDNVDEETSPDEEQEDNTNREERSSNEGQDDRNNIEGKKKKNGWQRYYGAKEVAKKYKGPAVKVLRLLPKAGLAVAGAAALGTVGIAAGLAGKDMSEVLKYGAAGIGAGMAIGNEAEKQLAGLGKKAIKAPKKIKDKFDKGSMTDEEYKDKIRTQENKEIMKKLEIDFRKSGYKKDQITAEKAKAQALFDAGLTGEKNIKDGMKLIDMQKSGKTQNGNTITKVDDVQTSAKRAAGAINSGITEKDIVKGDLDKYAEKKIKGNKGQEDFKDLVKAYKGMK